MDAVRRARGNHSQRSRTPGAAGVHRQRPGGSVEVTEGLARLAQDPSRRNRPIKAAKAAKPVRAAKPVGPGKPVNPVKPGKPVNPLRRARSSRLRRRRLRTTVVVLVVLILVGVFASSGGTADHTSVGTTASHRPAPSLVLSISAPRPIAVTGSTPTIPWVSSGESAIAVPSAGLLETSGPEDPVPIASLTKMMTAFLTLEQHPLTATSSGPKLVMTAVDQQTFDQAMVAGGSSVEVQAGEVLTERQLLSGLIVRSANNIADTLARWDSGNVPAFIAKMNAEAAALGMTSSHYADTSGFDSGTVSTAHDQLLLAQRAMELPSFASIVNQTTVTLPYIGTLDNYVGVVGTDGVVGIKSGFTNSALACVVLAAMRQVGNRQVMVLAADLGQPTTLAYAAQEDISMIDSVSPALQLVEVSPADQMVGRLSLGTSGATSGSTSHATSGGSSTTSSGAPGVSGSGKWTQVVTAAPLVAVGWPGTTVVISVRQGRIGHSVSAGAVVGTLQASSAGGPPVSVPLIAMDALRS